MQKHCETVQILANFLKQYTVVKKVIYPGLKKYPSCEFCKKHIKSPGAMILFKPKGGKKRQFKY